MRAIALLLPVLSACATEPALVDFGENRAIVQVHRFDKAPSASAQQAAEACAKFGKSAAFMSERWVWGDSFEHVYSCEGP